MSLINTYIVIAPGKQPEYMDFKALLTLAKKAIESPKYNQWLKKQHLLPIWTETIDDKKLRGTKLDYIKLYLETQFGYVFEEI